MEFKVHKLWTKQGSYTILKHPAQLTVAQLVYKALLLHSNSLSCLVAGQQDIPKLTKLTSLFW